MVSSDITADSEGRNVAAKWDDSHHYTPGPRHRRRLLLKIVSQLRFQDCLDAGCAQPYLLEEIVRRSGAKGYGCDLSDQQMALNRQSVPGCDFVALDLSQQVWPDGRQFDLVICSEVLEHIADWHTALRNLVQMTRQHLLITVPGGKLGQVERRLGHHRHYKGPEIVSAIEALGFEVVMVRRWGFPFYDLFKATINRVAPDKVFDAFTLAQRPYSFSKKMMSHGLYAMFFVNDPFPWGDQLIVLARKRQAS
jgi:SAM-dependent methyltransferase